MVYVEVLRLKLIGKEKEVKEEKNKDDIILNLI